MTETMTSGQQPVAGGPGPGSGPQLPPEMAAVMAFIERFMSDTSAAAVGVMCALGDRLGLFGDLARHGPATSAELAGRTGQSERYLREWLLTLGSAGYLELDRDTGRFRLPPPVAAALADENAPFYMGDMARLIPALSTMLTPIADGFRTGAGVPAAAYPAELHETMWRKDASRLGKVLVPQWVPAVDGLRDALEHGGRVAQLGCGDGRALILLAQAFDTVSGVGYDPLEVNVRQGRTQAAAAGVAERVTFRDTDPAAGLPEGLALVLALDVLHDAADPPALLRRVRDSLDPSGVFLLLETNGEDLPLAQPGPVNALLYGISALSSVPQGLAAGADPVGMMGLPPGVLLPMCRQAGFGSVRPVLMPSPFNTLYELRP